jgi:transposase
MEQYQVYIGIDVSKNSFDLAVHSPARQLSFTMNSNGFTKAGRLIVAEGNALVVIEATGGYERPLVLALQERRIDVAVINPVRVRNYARACGQLAKTDKIDATVIASYAATFKPEPNTNNMANIYQLQDLSHRRQSLKKMIAAEKCRADHILPGTVKASIAKLLKHLIQQVDAIELEMNRLITDDEVLKRKHQVLMSYPGIGSISSFTLLSEMPQIGQLNRGQVASLAGLAPFARDSGIFKGRRTILGGRIGIRRGLYMPALVAVRHNQILSRHYRQLLKRGKSKQLALTACMRKMLVILNAMVKSDELFTAHRYKSNAIFA